MTKTTTKSLGNEWSICCSGVNLPKLVWDFRVIKRTFKRDYIDDAIVTYGVHQVFIDENGDISRIEDNPVPVFDRNLEKLSGTIEKIRECLKKPVIDYDTGEEIKNEPLKR